MVLAPNTTRQKNVCVYRDTNKRWKASKQTTEREKETEEKNENQHRIPLARDLFSIRVFNVFLLNSIINCLQAEALCARRVNANNLFKANAMQSKQ